MPIKYLKRGRELWYRGIYPMIVTKDTEIPFDDFERRTMLVPVTDIIAFGDADAEKETEQRICIMEFTFKSIKK